MMGHRLEQSGKGGLCSMDQKNRTILVLAIAVTVFAAVFVSLGLPALTGRAPEVVLPDVNQEAVSTEGRDFLPVEVRPDTVQSVIASLSRPESYHRQLTVRLFWAGGSFRRPGGNLGGRRVCPYGHHHRGKHPIPAGGGGKAPPLVCRGPRLAGGGRRG